MPKVLRRWCISLVAICLSLFALYIALIGPIDSYAQRNVHLGLGLLLGVLLFPSKGRAATAVDLTLLAAVIAAEAYLLGNLPWLTYQRFPLVTELRPVELLVSGLVVLAVLEVARRVIGWFFLAVVLTFALYPLIGSYLGGPLAIAPIAMSELLDFLVLTPNAIYGVPISVSANEIALFMVFAAFAVRVGLAQLFFDIASAIASKTWGGAAKVSVISSAFVGSITGTPSGNVATTGSFTIPTMIRSGIPRTWAGATEAVASCGGQFLPPVMGAAVFVMAAFTGIPYAEIVRRAFVPAILFFVGVYLAIHFTARKSDWRPVTADADAVASLAKYGHLLLPVAALVGMLVLGYSPGYSAAICLVGLALAANLRKATRMRPGELVAALEDGGKFMLIVIAATAAAGIIVGVVDLTGLGQRFGSIVAAISGHNYYLALLVTMVFAIFLGLEMPPTAAYLIQVALTIPVLLELGVPTLSAHLFVFFYSALAVITPPVATASYAAATLAKAPPMATALTAFRLGLPAYILPFAFVLNPELLLAGGSLWSTAAVVAGGVVAMLAVAIASSGYFLARLGPVERGLALVAAVLFILPLAPLRYLMAGGVVALLLVGQIRRRRTVAGVAEERPAAALEDRARHS
jgi:TRAP transporter 4TM/12TM fusion protein